MNSIPLLSICIPTYNRLDILYNTLNSIYSDLDEVQINDFEVVVSDNEPNQSSKKIVERFNHKNLRYYPTNCEGFLNSLNALKQGKGLFLKLHNNYTKLRKGTLKEILKQLKENSVNKPLLFYSDGMLKSGNIMCYNSFDSFMYHLSYFSSWSTGFGIWREDFINYNNSVINRYFPQTSLLISQTKKKRFVIDDRVLFENQQVPQKGGYNIFRVFAIDYISIIKIPYQKNEITKKTFERIKNDLLFDYLSVRYFKTVILKIDTFNKDDLRKSITSSYSALSYYLMILASFLSPFKFIVRKIMIAFNTKSRSK